MANEQRGGHEHEHDEQGTPGLVIGVRIFDIEGELYLAEAEITAHEADPNALSVLLLFHPLAGIDPLSAEEDEDARVWWFDFDDELTRDPRAPVVDQMQDVLRQLAALSPEALREYFRASHEENGGDGTES